jgi:hypothetical protein
MTRWYYDWGFRASRLRKVGERAQFVNNNKPKEDALYNAGIQSHRYREYDFDYYTNGHWVFKRMLDQPKWHASHALYAYAIQDRQSTESSSE